jgi:hypothetical protein
MASRARIAVAAVLLVCLRSAHAADGRFDLVGPRIDVRVTRAGVTLPIASVPNLQPGDKLWIHPDLPPTQSVKYLLICVFLRGNTNPPPADWFTRIPTWDRRVRAEGTYITVPAEAQQALLFMAPETGGDFATLRSAVQGRPGAFVRASQDLTEAGFEQARIEKYLASIRRVPPGDPADLQKHSDLLSRTLALKPNADCFKRPVDTQFTCLTQTGSQIVLDDGHGQTIVNALSNGPNSDFIQAASYTNLAGGGLYSAYVGAIVDLVRILGNLHTAQYQYIPAISFPQAEAMNLRLNMPPSFHNPKSVLVIALPSVQAAVPPPLRPADANAVSCLLQPNVVLPIEGAPLVFSADFATDLVLHLNTPPGAPAEPDIPLTPDAYAGGLALQQGPQHHVPLRDPELLRDVPKVTPIPPQSLAQTAPPKPSPKPEPEPVLITGTIQGRWGFDPFTGPTVQLQQLPGTHWTIVPADENPTDLIAGRSAELHLTSTGTACVHTITAHPTGSPKDLNLTFKPENKPGHPNVLALTLPLEHNATPGDLHLAIQQYDQPKPDEVAARTFTEPATITAVEAHAGDRNLLLRGTRLNQIDKLTLGDLVFKPTSDTADESNADSITTLHLTLANNGAAPSTHIGDHLTARVELRDGRTLTTPIVISTPRPAITLLRKSTEPAPSVIALTNPDDLPLNAQLTFTLKSPTNFPRNGQVEIETLDGTLRTVLTLAPSGGLLLQDPHTVVATLDPLRSFGPSAFGALHLRVVFPTPSADQATPPASDWLPLATLVRLPTLSQLACPADLAQPCTINGSNLFLLQSVSADPAFTTSTPVPDGFTGPTLTVPHLNAATLFFKLRDDPNPTDSAILPLAPAAPTHTHSATHKAAEPTTPKSPAASPGPSL